MSKNTLIIIFQLFFLISKINSQSKIDSFINTLHNKDIKTELALVLHDAYMKDERGIFVKSWRIDFPQRILKFNFSYRLDTLSPNKVLIVNKLIQQLSDSDRDFFANFLLYEITGILSNLMPCEKREDWFKEKYFQEPVSMRDHDMQFWKNYAVGMSLFNKYWFVYFI
ncbi:MAG TPA: hypothetical protein VHZ50_06220 [Puia sp.]|jgi:hypothetical protein|nr:hypothetical protein [Puia sp.]